MTRRFLRVGTAKDGAVYTTIGQPISGAAIYSGQLELQPGATSVSQDYTKNPRRDFAPASSCHTGFKPSGAIFTKFDRLGYSVMSFPALKDLHEPALLQQIYPAPLTGFAEISAPRRHDVMVPLGALSPVNLRAQDIEERFGDQPFHLELIAIPRHMAFLLHNPSTAGFIVELDMPLYRAAFVFRQDDADLQRGWLDRTRSISARIGAPDAATRLEASAADGAKA